MIDLLACEPEPDSSGQVWVLVTPPVRDPFDLIDGFEVGADTWTCRAVQDGGRLILGPGGVAEELALALLYREARDHA